MAQGVKIELTPRQTAYLQRHFKNTKNAELAEHLGISESTLHRLAREYGLTKTRAFQKKMQQNATARAQHSHLVNNTFPQKGYIIPNSEKYRFKKGERRVDRIGKRREKEAIKKAAATRKETYRKEKARVLFGLEQKTKMRVIRQPHYIACQRTYLRRLGYIVARGSSIAYYTDATRRSEEYESRTRDNHKRYVAFKFLPLPMAANDK